MKKIKILIFKCLVLVFLASCESTTYYVVRHAEKDTSDPADADPPLSAAGSARAIVLCDTLQNKGIDTIFATQYQRTQLTAQPAATLLGKTITIVNSANTANLITTLQTLNGKEVLVVGHSNTVPQIVQGLCGEVISPIAETDYDNMYIIKIQKPCMGDPDTTFTHITYGAITN